MGLYTRVHKAYFAKKVGKQQQIAVYSFLFILLLYAFIKALKAVLSLRALFTISGLFNKATSFSYRSQSKIM